MRFSYYRRLGRRDQATYRDSDAIVAIAVPDVAAARALLPALAAALAADDRPATARATRQLVACLCTQLGAGPLVVRVLARRPRSAASELHGLYERDPEAVPILRVWMRTAAQRRPVAFRTFVRTVLHELCHHFDFELHGLRDTFHTEGFFRRESSLARQLIGAGRARAVASAGPRSAATAEAVAPDTLQQLALFPT